MSRAVIDDGIRTTKAKPMSTFDPDLDAPRARPLVAAGARNALGEKLAEYHRLVANPLPAIVGLVGAWAVLHYALRTRNLPVFLVALVLIAVCPILIQFHCLDCGLTDFAIRSRRHACEPTRLRWRSGTPSPRTPPRLRTQVRAWVWSLFAALLIYGIMVGVHL